MNVYIVSPNPEYVTMFQKNGWNVVNDLTKADLIQFTGGSDVNPAIYNQSPHSTTHYNASRDEREMIIFKAARHLDKPVTGICRGGQFLNVMCGGSMWQDVDGHANGKSHRATDTRTGEVFHVTSTHHQMMIPADSGEVILIANESTRKEKRGKPGTTVLHIDRQCVEPDVEAVWYEEQRAFCFQPHPEFSGNKDLSKRYMDYLFEFFGLEGKE